MGVLVFRDGERRAMKVFNCVAVLATILVGGGGKLFVMRVLMAIRAGREFYFVESVLAGWRVAFVASDGRVLSFQRIVRCRVLFNAKLGWLPALHSVALRALPLARPRLELAFMRVRGMATRALGKGQLLFEIASRVAIAAPDFQMHSKEGIFCFRMVKLHGRIHFFPAGRCVAGFARSLEGPFVGIGVAVAAGAKLDAGKFHRFVGPGWEVALLAGHLRVHPGEGIFCFRMVELLGLFPVGHVVAALAVGAELSFVNVLMAGRAVLREPQE